MERVREVLVVEGKYDAIRLASVVEATVVTTNGFRIFRDREALEALQRMAVRRGIVLLTDSDGAGLVIRNYLQNALPGVSVKHAYIPPVPGKERRKAVPSKEGLLGVEGMDGEVILAALHRAGATMDGPPRAAAGITRLRLFEDGLTGGPDSAARRRAFLRQQGLPEYLSTAKLLAWINAAMTEKEYAAAVKAAAGE